MKRLLWFALACSAGVATLSAAPSIAALGVKNSASYANPGFPNGSIAQGSLFVVFGSGMGPAQIQYASSFPLPTNLSGTTATVTMNGTAYNCPVIYTLDGQIAAILPSNTPAGTGTIVVSFNGTPSPSAPIKVIASSPGIFTVNQQGTGPGVVQDGGGHQNALNYAFAPGQTVVVWGTGLGAITGSDANVPPTGNIPNVTVTANVGGKNAPVVYSGRSQDAGVDQINITLPQDVTTGCYVPLYLVATPGNGAPVTSNFVTISIASSGTTCSDPTLPNLTNNSNGYRLGTIGLARSTSNVSVAGQTINTTGDIGFGGFYLYDPTYLSTASGANFTDITVGSCTVLQYSSGTAVTPNLPKSLDAGPVINVNGPNGAKTMTRSSSGTYSGNFGSNTSISVPGLPNTPLYLDPGNYAIDNGTGGTDVGPFKLNLVVPPTFTWTNQSSISSIDRTQGLLVTWSGGDPNSQVEVVGSSYADNNAYESFVCYGKDSDLQLTVPSAILSVLPASATLPGGVGGSLSVSTFSSVTGTASGLDYLLGSVSFGATKTVSFK